MQPPGPIQPAHSPEQSDSAVEQEVSTADTEGPLILDEDFDLGDRFSHAVDWAQSNWELIAWSLGKIAIAIVIALIVHWVIFGVLLRFVKRTNRKADDAFIKPLRRPSRLIFPLLAVQIVLPTLTGLTEGQVIFVRHVLSILAIAAIAWLVIALVNAVTGAIKARHRIDVVDNLHARMVHTQMTVIARVFGVLIIIIAIAAALMTFPRVRELGVSLLASAGIAGLALGLAARPVLENLIAGLQLAFAQPIRIDDVVIVEGEWGRVEEITTTYVVVRIWDERRLIVPFSKFITEAFQNWTRTNAQILGTVYIYADYTIPVEAVRAEVKRLAEQSEKWDQRTCGLVVTDATEQTVQLRALISAANSSDAWDLRVWMREKLLEFIQREYPASLPRTRIDMREPSTNQPINKSQDQHDDESIEE